MSSPYNVYNIEAIFKEYLLAGKSERKSITIKNYLSDYRHFLGWVLATYLEIEETRTLTNFFKSLTSDTIEAYIFYLKKNQTPDATINRRLSTLRAFIQLCLNESWITESPFTNLKNITNAENIAFDLKEQPKEEVNFVSRKKLLMPVRSYLQYLPVFVSICLLVILFIEGSHYPLTVTSATDSNMQLAEKGKVLSFNGKLTNIHGFPILKSTNVAFTIYNQKTGGEKLYETGFCSLSPTTSGDFNVLIGGASTGSPLGQDICGKKIPASIFSDNASLYLGIKVGDDYEMQPRQQIANVSFASNSDELKGMKLGTGSSTIPYIDSSGYINLSGDQTGITATSKSGTFVISNASNLLLQTAGTGDVVLNASESGNLKFQTGNSPIDRIFISNAGNIGINTSTPTFFPLEISGSTGPSLSGFYNLGAPSRLWKNIYTDRLCFDGNNDCITSSSLLNINNATSSGGLTNPSTHADFAESYPVEQGAEDADVMVLGDKLVRTSDGKTIRQLVRTTKEYDNHIIGIVSQNYENVSSIGKNVNIEDNPKPIALNGRVQVKIASSSQSIRAGDYLTASAEVGKAMKADKPGVMIGKALEDWDPGTPKNKIMVFVSTTYVDPTNAIDKTFAQINNTFQNFSKVFITEKIISPVIETEHITTNTVTAKKITTDTIETQNASVSGTLTADHINSSTITDLNSNIKDIRSFLENLKKEPTPDPAFYQSTIPDISATSSAQLQGLFDNLIVTADANIFNLSVFNSINSQSDNLKIAAGSTINFFDDSIVLARDGSITAKGVVTALAGVKTNSITPIKPGDDLALTLNPDEIHTPRFVVRSSVTATPSASIDASGSAMFKKLELPDSAGTATIKEGESEVVIERHDLKPDAKIYVTPVSSLITTPLSVIEMTDQYFKVGIGSRLHPDIKFNWLIID